MHAGVVSPRYQRAVWFEIVGDVAALVTIATGSRVRESARLRKRFGGSRWRKMKGVATVRLSDGTLRTAEVHWYESHGVGRRRMKIKRLFAR